MTKVKLDLKSFGDQELRAESDKITGRVLNNVATFATPDPSLASINTPVYDMGQLIGQRDAKLADAKALTLLIRGKRDVIELGLTNLAGYVEQIANNSTNPANPPAAIIALAGMTAADGPTPVGPMPQIEGLAATQGDSNGEVDLHWNPIKRGLKTYLIEKTSDPAGLTGWTYAATATKSSAAVPGLTSGTRYWFRVAGVGTAGQGAWSDPATKVAP